MCRLFVLSIVWSALAFAQDSAQCHESVARARQVDALRKVLEDCGNFHELAEWIFVDEARLRAPLRALINDAKVGDRALRILALIGEPADVDLMMHRPPNGQGFTEDRWRYPIVSTLLQPRSESEWEFLRKAAISDKDRWVDFGAILALQFNHSSRSERILEEAAVNNPHRAGTVARALEFIHTNPPPFEGKDLEALGSRVASALEFANWKKNEAPVYNRARSKGIVRITLVIGVDCLTYTATFHRVGDRWILRGVRETLQQFVPPGMIMIAPRRTVPLLDEPPPIIEPIRVPPVER